MPEWLDKLTRRKTPVSPPTPPDMKPEAPAPQFRRVALLGTPDEHHPSVKFPRYEFFHDPDTFKLWFRSQKPEWIAINVANAVYVDGVNVAPSEWLVRTKTGVMNGMVLEIDPNLSKAADASRRIHTGNTKWANNYPGIQPVMVSALTTELLDTLRGKVQAAVVIAPAPLSQDIIIADTWQMLSSGGRMTLVLDPINSQNDQHPGMLKPDLPENILQNCPGATDINVNTSPYIPGKAPANLTVAQYRDLGNTVPRTDYIDHEADWDAPVFLMQVTKP